MEIIFIIFVFYIAIHYSIKSLINGFKNVPTRVPLNSIYIIDRNSHYYKTLTSGQKIHLGPNDKITTQISKTPIVRNITDFYETEDGKVLSLKVTCTYSSNDILNTQELLSGVRRSIDDIIQSAAYFAVGSLKSNELNAILNETIKQNLRKELASLDVSLISFSITASSIISPTSNITCFKPHISSSFHNAIQTKDDFADGPIKYN